MLPFALQFCAQFSSRPLYGEVNCNIPNPFTLFVDFQLTTHSNGDLTHTHTRFPVTFIT